MSATHEFEETLDALERDRNAGEEEYFAVVRELQARVSRLIEATHQAERLAAGAGPDWPDECARPTLDRGRLDPIRAGQDPWPAGGGWVRRRVNGLARWLLRDYIATLDRRHEAVAAAFESVSGAIDGSTRRALDAIATAREEAARDNRQLQSAAAASSAADRQRLEGLREGLVRAAEALDLIVDLQERARRLADLKDAETLQRAAHGPLRKMEIVFDEFARQQEALLAELVGRRRDLDRMIAQLRKPAKG